MRVLMLGWEFPPFISGGLGTACYGLTRALSRRGTEVVFVLPRPVDTSHPTHVHLLAPPPPTPSASPAPPASSEPAATAPAPVAPAEPDPAAAPPAPPAGPDLPDLPHVSYRLIAARLHSPYQAAPAGIAPPPPGQPNQFHQPIRILGATPTRRGDHLEPLLAGPAAELYQPDLLGEVRRYARLCRRLARGERFDLIHAHDWMTFPAGMAVAAATGKALVVHVHSTELDRAVVHPHPAIYEIERRGMHAACRVVAVSRYTRAILEGRYGIPSGKIDVVYNGIETNGGHASPEAPSGGGGGGGGTPPPRPSALGRGDKVVLFLGRITAQKGPEYFIQAARQVLEKVDNVKFVMAGTGDLIYQVIELAARAGIGHKVLFTGFLRGREVDQAFQMADLFVMPSVSEPFGLATLEAVAHDVPVIVSRTSGVAEVLRHALKVDFWNTQDLADKMLAVLRRPALSQSLRRGAEAELKGLTWDHAADQLTRTYQRAAAMVPG